MHLLGSHKVPDSVPYWENAFFSSHESQEIGTGDFCGKVKIERTGTGLPTSQCCGLEM